MMFEILDLKPRNPFLSLALDEAVSRFMGSASNIGYTAGVRLWTNPQSIILGRTCRPADNLTALPDRDALNVSQLKRNWSNSMIVLRRPSGGGTVLHGPGNLNYSIFLSLNKYPDMFPLRHSYEVLLGIVRRALQRQGIECEIRGLSDLVIQTPAGERKISGNAQFRKHGVLVFHGTLIIRNDLIQDIVKFLKHPPREPDYRRQREHLNFLGALPETFEISTFYNCFVQEMQSIFEPTRVIPADLDDRRIMYKLARELVYSVYTNPDWILNASIMAGSVARSPGLAAQQR
ncbi:MAG: lipoate--protein ligase family protein [Leptospiraceae bacterium]|nr:lipoate--protein ligase family protein [Leptospiraceae bacterium]